MCSKKLFVLAYAWAAFAFTASAVNRTWTGAVNTDFNNVGNWTGGGSLAATDNFTITLTVNANTTISLSSSITVGNLVFTMNSSSGARTGKLMVGANTLTVNGLAQFNSVRYSSPISYDVLKLDVSTGGTIIFNGQCNFHTTGNGDTYLTTNDLTGSTALPGTVYFNAGLQVGTWGRTVGTYEPHMIFNGAGTQTAVIKCNGGAYMFKSQDLTIGTTASPTVTVRGAGAVYFDSYDGNFTMGAGSEMIVPDTAFVGYMTVLDRYNTGAGAMTMGANSAIITGCPNKKPLSGFATYALDATSLVNYNSSGWQDMMPVTYGSVICDGAGGPAAKYSNGAQTMQADFTVQNAAVYQPWLAGGLTVNGNVLLQSNGVFNATRDNNVANITHTLKGNFTNNAIFTSGSPVGANTMLFTSSVTGQTIGGSSVSTFYNLTCDNNSASGITLLQDENVANVWSLTNGPVYLNSHLLTVQNTATSAITRTNGYAVSETNAAINNSKIQWNMTAASTGAHVFPFGVSGTYIPFTFSKTSTANAVNVAVSTRATSTDDNTPWAGASNVAAVNTMFSAMIAGDGSIPSVIDRWWDITASAAVTADLTFSYRGSENTTTYAPTGSFGAQHWNGSSWDDPIGSGTGVTSGVGTVSVSGANTFSPWVLSSLSAPLPVELLNFTAVLKGRQVALGWSTATETNCFGFAVERSADGVNYTQLASLQSKAPNGSSLVQLNYDLIDGEPLKGVSYYRLKQIDRNGYSHHYPAQKISMDQPAAGVFPNPISKGSALQVATDCTRGEQVEVVVYDMKGAMVFSHSFFVAHENEILRVDEVRELGAGHYLIKVIAGAKISQHRMVVE